MNQIAVFKVNDQEFPLSIHDAHGRRWVPANEVGAALGHSNIRNLINDLESSGEIAEGKHIRKVTLQMPGDTQPRRHSVLSLRGIIRVAMRAQTERAIAFRDWAEDVLAEVMETGSYTAPSKQPNAAQLHRAAATIVDCHIKVAKMLGCGIERARLIGVERAKEETGVDYAPFLLGTNGAEEKPLNPTGLGKMLSPTVGAMAANKLLERAGFQIKDPSGDWIPTEKGKRFCSLEPYQAPNGHTGYRAMWFPKVLDALKAEATA